MWCRVGDPGPHIHYHFKTCCSDQMAGKRKFNVRVLPWLKHLQSCDSNRVSGAEMKLGLYVRVLYVCVCLHYSFHRSVYMCALKRVRTISAERSPSCDVQPLGSWLCRQGDNLAVEMTHGITSSLLTTVFAQKYLSLYKNSLTEITIY